MHNNLDSLFFILYKNLVYIEQIFIKNKKIVKIEKDDNENSQKRVRKSFYR